MRRKLQQAPRVRLLGLGAMAQGMQNIECGALAVCMTLQGPKQLGQNWALGSNFATSDLRGGHFNKELLHQALASL